MNLADAIRRAAQASGTPLGQPDPRGPHEGSEPFLDETEGSEPNGEETHVNNYEETNHGQHNTVKLELVLNPEQLKGFFGAVIASQHSVLTLREAAGFLRVSQAALEQKAEEGDVPGMQVDGKWRFTRPALEDWLSGQSQRKEA